jgi:hypothetical protein
MAFLIILRCIFWLWESSHSSIYVAPLLIRLDFALRFGPYFVEPVIAGIEEDGTPFIAGADLIGCLNHAKVPPFCPLRLTMHPADIERAGLCRFWHRIVQTVRYGRISLGAGP